MNRKLWTALSLLALIAIVGGCSEKKPSEPTQLNTSLNLNTPTGGYTASSEAPGFGDPLLSPSSSGEKAYNDSTGDHPEVDSMRHSPYADWFHFRARWGHLVPDTTETVVTDWTGSLEINRGALVLRRTCRFDGLDSVLPRTDRKKIEWVSHTTTRNDGVAVDIFVPRPKPVLDSTVDTVIVIDTVITVDTLTNDTTFTFDTTQTPVVVVDTTFPPNEATLTFTTPQYTRSFSLAELMKLDTIIELADSNEVAFQAMKIYRNVCPRGFLAGYWSDIDSTGLGYIKGRWISKFGEADGYFEGHYGINGDSVKVFFGKWIDSVGGFEGFLQGRWGRLPSRHNWDTLRARGWFSGQILDANETRIGVVRGGFVENDSLAGGFLGGRWKLICNDEDGDNPGGHGGQERGHDDDGMED